MSVPLSARVQELVGEFREWLSKITPVEVKRNLLRYDTTAQLHKEIQGLIQELKELNIFKEGYGYTVWRISGKTTIEVPDGPGYLIPINIEGAPRITPGDLLKSDIATYISEKSVVTPELDCVFIVPLPKKT